MTNLSDRVEEEWNPHTVRKIPKQMPELYEIAVLLETSVPKINCSVEKKQVKEHLKNWRTKWNKAQSVLNAIREKGTYPLIYRLEPRLSKLQSIDPVEGSKFGGIPDLRNHFDLLRTGPHKALEIISEIWPKCGDCGNYMSFLAGVDLNSWLFVIHALTKNHPTHNEFGDKLKKEEIRDYQYSAVKREWNLSNEFWPALSKPIWNIFYCHNYNHQQNPSYDARIVITDNCKERTLQEELMNLDQYQESIEQFIKKHNIKSTIPLQKIDGFELRFDLDSVDLPEEEDTCDWELEMEEKHPDLFGSETKYPPYRFFGRPHSQQTAPWYVCQNTMFGGSHVMKPHRMAPIINWEDIDGHHSNQLYGCITCASREHGQIYCKNDCSST